jgi:transposase
VNQDPTRTCAILVDLPDIVVLGAEREGSMLSVHIQTKAAMTGCPSCGVVAQIKERVRVSYCDLPVYGIASTLVWHKRRFVCRDVDCDTKTWSEVDDRIAAPRMTLTDRAGRFATKAVGQAGRSVNEVAEELGCDWHTVNDAVLAYGTALIEHPERFDDVTALGLDETAFVRLAPYFRTNFITSIVDVGCGQLLDIVPGRGGQGTSDWLQSKSEDWRASITHGTLDLSSAYRKVFTDELPHVTLVADPFHVVKLATSKLDEVRRRVQNETLGHRGRKDDPLYRGRRLLAMAEERLSEDGKTKLLSLLEAGDPKGEVTTAWHAKEAVRELYSHQDQPLALRWLDELAADLADGIRPAEVRSLGRTLKRWRSEITAWHACHFTNGPTEAINNLIKRVKRVAFGFTSFRNYRIRALLYAGKPNWSLLEKIKPC